jgi:hypothetical protein
MAWDATRSTSSKQSCLSHVGFLLDLLSDPEDGADVFSRNLGLSPDCTASHLTIVLLISGHHGG